MNNFSKKTGAHGLRNCLIVLLLNILFLFGCSNELNQDEHLLLTAAEFDEQESTFICWNPTFKETILNLTQIIAKHDHVTFFYNERNHNPEKLYQLFIERGILLDNIALAPFNLEEDNVWIRDYGPTFMEDEKGNQSLLNFHYDHENSQEYNLFGKQYSDKMKLSFFKSKMFSEGGGREINGKGTMLLIESYEKFINPNLSLVEIENEYKERLNQKNIIWLKRGVPQDDSFDNGPVHDNIYGNGVNGHIDEFCRFADKNTILLAQVDEADLKRDSYFKIVEERLEENYDILTKSKDQDGNPFKIIRVPLAPVLFNDAKFEGKDIYYTPVTSYLNFVLTNQSVVIPSYYEEGDPDFIREKDEAAKQILQKVFSNRKAVMLNSLDLNYYGGGLHCITLHKPKIIKHPFWKRKIG